MDRKVKKMCCIVPQYVNIKHEGLSFHKLSKSDEIRKKWVNALKMSTSNSSIQVCADHFISSDFFHSGKKDCLLIENKIINCALFPPRQKNKEEKA